MDTDRVGADDLTPHLPFGEILADRDLR